MLFFTIIVIIYCIESGNARPKYRPEVVSNVLRYYRYAVVPCECGTVRYTTVEKSQKCNAKKLDSSFRGSFV